MSCSAWTRLGPNQRADAVDRMIGRVVSSHTARQYGTSKPQVARCLQRYARSIEYAFDDVCSESRSAGMQAINNTFNRFVWGCVR
jgi:hypothetical protein